MEPPVVATQLNHAAERGLAYAKPPQLGLAYEQGNFRSAVFLYMF